MPEAIFFMGIQIPNTSVVFNPHTYYTMTNLVLFLDSSIVPGFVPVVPGLASVLPGCGPFVLWHGPACGSASVLGCFPPGSVFPGAGYGPAAVGFKTVYLTDWVQAFLDLVF